MGKKKKQKQARPVVTDVSAVKTSSGDYVVSRSYAETVDLLGEGPIEGVVSGEYLYIGNEGQTGYTQVQVDLYTATGIAGDNANTDLEITSQQVQLGFLRSIYWNEVPVVDKDGYYNFQTVNVNEVKGDPIGSLPAINTSMNNYTGLTGDDVLDLTVFRSIGERLYGPEVASGADEFPTAERMARIKSGTKIDKYSKTYTILNKECSKIQLNIKINSLFENLQAGPKTYKKSSQLSAQGSASAGYGDTKARTIEYFVYWQPVFDERFRPASSGTSTSITTRKSTFSAQGWLGPIKETVQGKVDQGYIRTTTIDLSKEDLADTAFFEGWRIRIVRTTPESLTSFLRNVSFVDSIVEVYGTQLRYPYSAMMYSQFDARSFSRIPGRNYDTRLLKVKVPNNYDPETKTYGRSGSGATNGESSEQGSGRTGSPNWIISPAAGTSARKTKLLQTKIQCRTMTDSFWDGGFKTELSLGNGNFEESPDEIFIKEWTDNPAWCFYDILTNKRYGLGEYIKEEDIDKWSLYEIGQYCDVLVPDGYGGIEPRFTFNYIITSREEAFKVINDLASAFRGMAYFANGSIRAVQDNFKTPMAQFTTSNVIDGDFNYASSAKRARHTVAIVRYNDKRNLYQPAVEYVEDEEAVRRYGIREIETTALGCTSKGQARRFAKWILASEAQETETVSFSIGMEGSYLNPGDIIQVYDNFRNPLKYSGRTNMVKPLTANTDATYNSNQQGQGVAASPFGANFDSIIVDQAIPFTGNKLYKLDLLTPTYDYPTNTEGLTSEDFSGTNQGVNRSQIQTVLFSGAHTKTYTADTDSLFRSDHYDDGKGLCTQIFFNTGGFFGGVSNKLDFSEYAITGYTTKIYNNQGSVFYSDGESYSGGYFSGQNLIWSCEPNNPNDDTFVSGNSSSYRIINLTEGENSSYNVSALAYSTGKYDQTESAIEFEGKNTVKTPLFPTGEVVGRQCLVNDFLALSNPFPGGKRTSALNVEIDAAFPGGQAVGIGSSELDKYRTLKVTFLPAGYELKQLDFYDESQEANVTPDTSLNYAVVISRSACFNLTTNTQEGTLTSSQNEPFIANRSNWEQFETGIELFIPGQTVGEKSQYGTYDTSNPEVPQVINYSAEFIIYEPDIEDYYVGVFALSKEGAISDGMISHISVEPNKDFSQSFSAVNSINISNITTDSLTPSASLIGTLQPIESLEPSFGWETSFAKIFNIPENEATFDPASPYIEEPFYELDVPENTVDYRITVRKPSERKSPNIPNSKIYVEITGLTPNALSPDFAFSSIYNNPNILTGIREEATTSAAQTGVTIYQGGAKVTNQGTLQDIIDGKGQSNTYIRNDSSGYNILNEETSFPLRSYDVVVEAHDSQGKTSARNKIWANTILGPETKEPNWRASSSKYDMLGVIVEPPSGLIFASQGTDSAVNPLQPVWLASYEAFALNYPYRAEAKIYPNGYLDISIQHSQGSGPDAGKTISTDEDLEKYFNNIAGVVYYMTTGSNLIEFGEGQMVAPLKAKPFNLDVKIVDDDGNLKIQQEANENAGFVGRKDNSFFGGIIPNASTAFNDLPSDYEISRGYYLLAEDDTIDDLRIPVAKVALPQVENVQISLGFFDELSLLRAFEEDGKTPKFVGKDADGNKKSVTPKIFTDPDILFSTIPKDLTSPIGQLENVQPGQIPTDPSLEAYGTSLFLSESSIMGAGDIAAAFRGWMSLNLQTKSMGYKRSPRNPGVCRFFLTNRGRKSLTLAENDFVDISVGQNSVIFTHPDTVKFPPNGLTEGAILPEEKAVFKDLILGENVTLQYRIESIISEKSYGQSRSKKALITPFRKLELRFTIKAAQLNGIDINKTTIMSDISINQKVDFDGVVPAFSINKSQTINDEENIIYSIIITETNDHMQAIAPPSANSQRQGQFGGTTTNDPPPFGIPGINKDNRQGIIESRQSVQQWLGEEVVITLGVLASNQ